MTLLLKHLEQHQYLFTKHASRPLTITGAANMGVTEPTVPKETHIIHIVCCVHVNSQNVSTLAQPAAETLNLSDSDIMLTNHSQRSNKEITLWYQVKRKFIQRHSPSGESFRRKLLTKKAKSQHRNTRYMGKGYMILPKDHNSLPTAFKDIKLDEMPHYKIS
jgi:hypothetical protein